MKRIVLVIGLLAALLTAAFGQGGAQPPPAAGLMALTPPEMKWTQGGLALPGMEQMNLVGDPAKPGPYTVRLKFPAGYKLAAHTHPDSREVTVLSGTWYTGYGEKSDVATLKELPAGSFYTEPANVAHFVEVREPVMIQVSGTGPSGRKFVNPADKVSNNAQQSPPTSAQAKQIEAMVNKAAELVNNTGKAAFAEFRKSGSEWWSGNTYLFVYDLNSNVLLNPAFPKKEGTNTTGQKDANGKLYHHEFINVVQSKGSGWVDYMFPKPGQTEPSRKWSYVKAVNIDGTPGLIGAGFYPE